MWLTDTVLVQPPGSALSEALNLLGREAGGSRQAGARRRFVHVVNPYTCPLDSHDGRVQELTFESMARARRFTDDGTEVEVVAVVYPEDQASVPAMASRHALLKASAADLEALPNTRRLPLLFDILEVGIAAPDPDDYVVFTNTDIALMPSFYATIAMILESGCQAITVNRRTIPEYDADPRLLPLMYAELGVDHPGFDCFVFPAAWTSKFIRNDACVGAGGVMRGLLYNLVALARPLFMIDHNTEETRRVLAELAQSAAFREPLAEFCVAHRERYTIVGDSVTERRTTGLKRLVGLLSRSRRAS